MIAVGARLGPYEIVAPLGAGGMGEVYKARDTRLNRTVAIKILPADVAADPQRRERFRREARAISSLSHPRICSLFDVGEADGVDFLVMEYLAGETLAHRLLRGALPLDDVLRIAGQLADALDGAHREGIVHRDLKPANVMLTSAGVKVLDFGLAKWHSGGPDSSISTAHVTANPTLTQMGSVVGTVQYMAPEQVEGKTVDARADLFALGAIIYEMTTGRKAFEGTSSTTVMAAILTATPPPMATLQPITPATLERVVRKCLAKDSAKRWQTASDLRDALAWIGDDALAQPAPSSSTKLPTARRRFGLAVMVPIAILALVAVINVGTRSRWLFSAPIAPSIGDLQITQLTSTGNAEAPAISPDGKDVAYIERESGGFSLWRRQIASMTRARIVPPEPGIRILDATVTPDGGFVDFTRSGGALPDGGFVDLTRRVGALPGELWRVPFLGGTPRKLIDFGVDGPIGWSPDGRRMAFLRRFDTPMTSANALFIADADGSHLRVLKERHGSATFSTYPFRPDWSSDGRSVAALGLVTSDSPRFVERRLVVVDVPTGSERILPSPIFPDGSSGLAWLDQQSLVVSRASEIGGPSQLWWLSYPGGELSRLTNDSSDYSGVSLSADRGSLVTGRSEIRVSVWVCDGSGIGGKEIVPPGTGSQSLMSVAWAGERLLYITTATGRVAISAVTPGRGVPEEIVQAGYDPAATSNGQTLLFVSSKSGEGAGLWRVDAGDSNARLVLPGAVSRPTVAADDRQVIFVLNRSGLQTLWTVSLAGGGPSQLTNVRSSSPDVSPDGKAVVFRPSDTGGQFDVCSLPSCTSRRRVVAKSGGAVSRWTPDGRGIAYVEGEGDNGVNLWVQPLDGSPPHQLTHFTDNQKIADFAWSRDGKHLAIARITARRDIVLFRGLRR